MKILTLNIWGGRLHDPLLNFLKNSGADILCLQEVYHQAHGKDTIWLDGTNFNALNDLIQYLPEYTPFYHPHLEDWWGLAMFVRKGVDIQNIGETFVHKYKGHDMEKEVWGHTAKNIQYLKTNVNGKPVTVLNFHGLWNGMGKTDSEDRLEQSRKIVEFLKTIEGEIVFCGDFNLLPDTESFKIIEDSRLRNLIKEYGITSTRTSLYTKPEKFADYIFVSQGVEVVDFKVLPDEVSDHSPLCLEIA